MASPSPPDHKYPGIRIEGKRSTSPSSPGRRMTAARTFPPGALIATFTDPLVAIPAGPAAKHTCARCLSTAAAAGTALKACTGCRAVAYCGAACQRADWSGAHKAECRAFKRVRSKVQQDWLPTPVRALVQLLLRLDADADAGGGDAAREELGRLEGNVAGFRAGRVWKDLEMQALAGCTYAGWETSEENLRLAAELLCKIQTNSFDRSDPDVGQTGTFLDSTLAMVNHSCVPNAIVAFSGRKAFLRAEEEIKEGDEITISYIDYTKPKIFRQHGLEFYHFECTCPRCKDDLDVYQVFQRSPLIPLNSFSFVPNTKKLRKTPIDSKVAQDPAFRAQIEKIYVACSPEARVAPEQRFANLCQQWQHCEPLVREQMWAVEPLANVFQQAISYFTEQGNFLHALAVECFVAIRSDPYKYAAPFKQWRLKGLLMIAKTITNTELPTGQAQGQAQVHPGVIAAFEKADLSSLYQAILLMTLKYGEQAHSDEWSILAEAKAMLEDIESLDQRKEASIILHEWADNPEHPLAQSFFRDRAVKPVEELAGFAIEIMKAEFGSGKALVRR